MIAAAVAAFGFATTVSAQKDAAEKAKEGGVEHWIEYYKAEQRKRSPTPPQESDSAPPAERAKAAAREEAQSK